MEKQAPRFRKAVPHPNSRAIPLVDRLQRLLYEFDERGQLQEAKPLLLWLMKLAHELEDSE